MKNVRNSVLIGLLLLAILICSSMFPLVTQISHRMAEDSPQIAYMRKPILIMAYFVLVSVVAALVTGLLLVIRSTRMNIFEQLTVNALFLMAHLFSFATITSVTILLYSYSQIQMEVGLVGGQIIIASMILFLGANVLYFIADLFHKAVEYKEENDLVL